MPSLREKSAMFLNRAAELRAIADGMSDPENRDALLKLAENYETMAQRILDVLPGDETDLSK